MAASMFGTLGYMSRVAASFGLEPAAFVFWRGIIASAALLGAGLLVRSGGIGQIGAVAPNRRRALLLAAALGAALNVAMFIAFQRMAIAVALTCFYTFPALVTIAAIRLYGDRLEPRRLIALGLSTAGLLLVLLAPAFGSGAGLTVDPLGVALALFSALCQATFILVAGRGFAPLRSLAVATVVMLTATVVSAVAMVAFGDLGGFTRPIADARLWPWVVLGATTGAAIPTTAFIAGIARIGPARAAILMTFEPLVGATLAALLLGETPVPLQLLGGAMVFTAAVVLQTTSVRPAADADAPPVV